MLEACSPPPPNLHPLAQERMISVNGRWYYENVYTLKKRRFPKADDWEDELVPKLQKSKQKLITNLVMITANLECVCGAPLKFKHHYTDPGTGRKSSRKCDQIYVYLCSICSGELELTYHQLEQRILALPKGI